MDAATLPKLPLEREDLVDDGRVPGRVRRFSNLANWLSKPDKAVTRAEVWELLNRYEAGRAALTAQHFQRYADAVLTHWRARAWYRRLWRWARRVPPPPVPQLPATPLEDL